MAQQKDKIPGSSGEELTVVKKKDQDELVALLTQFRNLLLSHEARLVAIEGWITEVIAVNEPEEEGGGEVIELPERPTEG